MVDHAAVLVALFLKIRDGDAVMPKRRWPEALRLLKRDQASVRSAADRFRQTGWWEAALLLERPDRLEYAVALLDEGQVLTILDDAYPRRWVTALGRAAPAALWMRGRISRQVSEGASVVGSRRVSDEVWNFAFEAGSAVAHHDVPLISGGAAGCDTAAEHGALSGGGEVLRIIPSGIERVDVPSEGVAILSLCAPREEFSTAAAMERNALIYAATGRALVVESRFRTGGTWHGATGALRRRLTSFYHRESPEFWASALKAMGSTPVEEPEQFLSKSAMREEQTLLPQMDPLHLSAL